MILLCTSFLGHGRTFSYNLSLLLFFAGTRSPSSNQPSLPSIKSHNLPFGRGNFTLATLKPPLSTPLVYLPCFIYSCPREVPARRCSEFLGIAGFKEIANMER
jgi:hypothetical protein